MGMVAAMVAKIFLHDCGPYCRDDTHAAVVWCHPEWADPDLEYTLWESLRIYCQRVGAVLVHLEEAREAGPVPVGVLGESIDLETWKRSPVYVSADSCPYLVVWRGIETP